MRGFANTKNIAILAAGDIVVYYFSLILTLIIRYEGLPTRSSLSLHTVSFAILIVIFLIVCFSAGLYDKRSALFRGDDWGTLLRVQIMNIIIGVMFFYFAPVAIAPKANLFIYFVVSTALLMLWRLVMFPVFGISRKQTAILVGNGDDVEDLKEEINTGARYGLVFKDHVTPGENVEEIVSAIGRAVNERKATVIVADLYNEKVELVMPFLYELIFSGIQIVEAGRLYESVFDRIPLSLTGERWLVENSSAALGTRRVYDTMKRLMDIFVAGIAGIISLLIYPIVYAAIKMEDGGPIFVHQERVGKNGKIIRIAKFRSMTSDDSGSYGEKGKSSHRVTRVGKFIRLTRIDELPQLWSVIKGDQSLIGPRPELPALVKIYEKEISYYNARHLIKPGLSGWAQIYHAAHPHHAVAVEDTRDKLSYDLFYVKNRSLLLDLKIALQTAKAIISKQGV